MSYQVVKTTVFSVEKGGGNPCPVVLRADGFNDSDDAENDQAIWS
ncbi:hypothetical protein [Halalkalibacter oceani]